MLHAPGLRIDHKRLHQPVTPGSPECALIVSYVEVDRGLHAGAFFGFVCPIARSQTIVKSRGAFSGWFLSRARIDQLGREPEEVRPLRCGTPVPITAVREIWFSPYIRLPILAKVSDARTGETIARITSLGNCRCRETRSYSSIASVVRIAGSSTDTPAPVIASSGWRSTFHASWARLSALSQT